MLHIAKTFSALRKIRDLLFDRLTKNSALKPRWGLSHQTPLSACATALSLSPAFAFANVLFFYDISSKFVCTKTPYTVLLFVQVMVNVCTHASSCSVPFTRASLLNGRMQ